MYFSCSCPTINATTLLLLHGYLSRLLLQF